MVRLLRLETLNDAQFDANYDTDLIILPKSKIAVESVVFNRVFKALEVGDHNSEVELTLTGQSPNLPQRLPNLSVTSVANREEFLEDLSMALNGNTTLTRAFLDQTEQYWVGEWIVFEENDSGKINIGYKHSPVIPPFQDMGLGDTLFVQDGELINNPGYLEVFGDQEDKIRLDGTVPESTDYRYRIQGMRGLSLCKGAGFFFAQIPDSANNGLGGVAPVTNNGFGMGFSLSKEGISDDTGTGADFEIYFNRSTENYSFISNGAPRQNSTLAPLKVTFAGHPDYSSHDIMCMKIEDGKIIGSVFQDLPNSETQLFTYTLTTAQLRTIAETGIRPYMFFNGNNNHIHVRNVRVTMSPWQVAGTPFDSNDEHHFADYDDPTCYENNTAGIKATIQDELPEPEHDTNRFRTGAALTFTKLDDSITEYLGFTYFEDNHIVKNGVFYYEANKLLSYVYSDFFMVESLTLPVDSYDASLDSFTTANMSDLEKRRLPQRGQRKNIIATLPVNEALGEITLAKTNLIYVSLANQNILNLRNLRFRIVDKDFNTIETDGPTQLTLLLADPGER